MHHWKREHWRFLQFVLWRKRQFRIKSSIFQEKSKQCCFFFVSPVSHAAVQYFLDMFLKHVHYTSVKIMVTALLGQLFVDLRWRTTYQLTCYQVMNMLLLACWADLSVFSVMSCLILQWYVLMIVHHFIHIVIKNREILLSELTTKLGHCKDNKFL